MKNYVVGIVSFFENEMKLFKITAKNNYEALKLGMIEFNKVSGSEKLELDWQNSEEYPKRYEDLFDIYDDYSFDVVEV